MWLEKPFQTCSNYGLKIKLTEENVKDGTPFVITMLNQEHNVSFTNYYYSRETYNKIFKEIGFSDIKWHELTMPPQFNNLKEKSHWKDFFKISPIAVIELTK